MVKAKVPTKDGVPLDQIKFDPEQYHVCPSCHVVMVKNNFGRCYHCYCGWKTVVERCVQGGMAEDKARLFADEKYPWQWRT